MGTIYLKADLTDITIDNIGQYNLSDLGREEVEDLIKAGKRSLLLQIPTTTYIQYYMHGVSELTIEECEQIIRNSTDIWSDIPRYNQFSAEFLMEQGEKLSRLFVEEQRNITPEFVRIHEDHLNLSRLIDARNKYGDIKDFLVTPEMCARYLNRYLTWKSPKEAVFEAVENCGASPEQIERIHSLVNQWYTTPVNIEKLVLDYSDQRRAEYTNGVVTNFWREHSRKTNYDNWADYAEECERTGNDGLANTWYKSFFRGILMEILGYDD
jgi:hypothetical protein